MDSIQQRYHFEKQVLSTANGILHEGKDLSLQRHVFLYQIKENKQTTKEETKRLLGSVSHFANPSFFHMLDLDEWKDGVYAVLEYRSGNSLLQLLKDRSISLTFPQVLQLIIGLGEALQDAAEERIRGFSLTAENIWLDGDHLMVIDYWSEGDIKQRGVLGLVTLFYQLLSQTTDLPAHDDLIEKELSLSIEPHFPEKTIQFSKLISRVLKGHESLSSFLLGLQLVKQDEAPNQITEEEPAQHHPMEKEPAIRRRFLPFSKPIAITSGFLLLFILTYLSYVKISSNPTTVDSTPTTTDTTKPVAETKTEESPPPIELKVAPVPASDSSIIQVPDLHGLSREEAEKLALTHGLHYKYLLDYNELQEGFVFKQEPESGTDIPKGGYLTFWISKGPASQ